MNPDPFERQLSRQPWRSIPPEWREQILARATANPQLIGAGRSPAGSIGSRLREWLWPHPLAWAGLAVCWVATFTLLHLAAPSAAELAQAREGARIAQMVSAALDSPQSTALMSDSGPAPAANQPRRGRADQGRLATRRSLLIA